MSAEQVKGRPPNYYDVVKVFRMAHWVETVFAYDPFIYVPSGKPLPPELVAHESVHVERQRIAGVEAWWERYLNDPLFRYHEELLAHRAEYKYLEANTTNRRGRRSVLKHVAKRLASPLYGRLISEKRVAEEILG